MGGSSPMHRRRSYNINSIFPSSTSSYLLFLFVIWGLLAIASCRSKTCSVDRCSDVFRSVDYAKTDLERCKKLKVHKRCLSRMKIVCRGNLMYHSNVHINKSRMKATNCVEVFKNESLRPSVEKQVDSTDKQTCTYEKKDDYKFCGVFGDPHIRTFSDELITCKTNGSWTLVENDHIVVMATNAIVSHHTGATATVKLTVIVKEFKDCVNMSTYSADVSRSLPLTFIDGSMSPGAHGSTNITQLKSNDGVEITLRHISTTVIVRKLGGHLTFAITMPGEFVQPTKQRQMCVNGCPKEMQISHPDLLKKVQEKNSRSPSKLHPQFNEEQAREYCRKTMLDELKPCEEESLNRRRRGASNPKNRAKKEVTPSLMIAETISVSDEKRSSYTHEDAAAKSWKQLSSRTNAAKKNKKRRKHKNRNRKTSKNNMPLADEPVKDDHSEKLRHFNEKTKQKESLENNIIKNETNFYFEACVFDLRTTGDVTYAKSARAAFDDVTKMHAKGYLAPSASKNVLCKVKPLQTVDFVPPTVPPAGASNRQIPGGSASSAHANIPFILLCSILTTLILNVNFYCIIINISLLRHRSLFNGISVT